MNTSPEEADLMRAAAKMAKRTEALEAELRAAHAALEVAQGNRERDRVRMEPQCLDCFAPLLTEHAIQALAVLGTDFWVAYRHSHSAEEEQHLRWLWTAHFCSDECQTRHQKRKEQAAAQEAENMARFRSDEEDAFDAASDALARTGFYRADNSRDATLAAIDRAIAEAEALEDMGAEVVP